MKALVGGIGRGAKVLLLASAVVAATLALGQESRPASASDTEIFISRSSTYPTWDPVIIAYPDGSPVTVYVWAGNVDNALGLGGFDVSFSYDNSLFTVTALTESTDWLASTGRSVACPAPWWAGDPPYIRPIPDDPDGLWHGLVGCHTPSAPPPYGPQGSGLLATITIQPGSERTVAPLSLSYGSQLIDTGQVVGSTVYPPDVIPATVLPSSVMTVRCGDFDADNYVDLVTDILPVAFRYHMVDTDPEWDPMYDLDDTGSIDLIGDILATAMQYHLTCQQTVFGGG